MNAHAAAALPAPATEPNTTASEHTALSRFVDSGHTASARCTRSTIVSTFTRLFTDLDSWHHAGLEAQLQAPVAVRTLVAFAMTATGSRVDADYVQTCRSNWGHHAQSVYPRFTDTFAATAHALGFTDSQTRSQWCALAKIAAAAGTPPALLDTDLFDQASAAMTNAHTRTDGTIPLSWSTPLHGLRATATALELITEAHTQRLSPSSRSGHWETLTDQAPQLTATMRRYLAQIGLSMRPGSVALIDTTVRHLATYLTGHHHDVTAVADIHRTHIEGFKAFLAAKPGYRGNRRPTKTTIGMRMSHLRSFFERIIEWDYPDAPARNPVFAGDMPIRDRPLPRFLPDADAAALLSAARALPTLFDRVAVEVLARTGLRKGEFLGLTHDALTTIDGARWLRTPVGKLHTDRYIPVHPRVDELLTEWITAHPPGPGRSPLIFIDHGRPIPGRRVDNAVHAAADAAGVGHVTPHQLRHTLATPGDQPRHEHRIDRRATGPLLAVDDHDIRPHLRSDRRRGILRRHQRRRSPLQPRYRRRRTRPRGRNSRYAPAPRRIITPARQRLLHAPGRAGLPLRDDLRNLHALLDQQQ